MEQVVIKVRRNGPYKVTGPVTIVDADGNEFDIPEGDGIVLCRCGASTTKPFCDKTHSKIGFEAAERAVREAGDSGRLGDARAALAALRVIGSAAASARVVRGASVQPVGACFRRSACPGRRPR